MATSGTITTGYYNYTAHELYWSLTSQSTANNTSTVSWVIRLRASGATPTWYSNSIKVYSTSNVNGSSCGSGTWSNITIPNGTTHTLLSGSKTISHNSDGTKTFSAGVYGWLYGYGDHSKTGSWSLPTIPRGATFNSVESGWSEDDPLDLNISNPANGYIKIQLGETSSDSSTVWHTSNLGRVSGAQTITPSSGDFSTLYAAHPNDQIFDINVKMKTYSDSGYTTQIGSEVNSNSSFSIVNAEPTFTTISYADTNSTTSTITGDDQYIIQGYSNVVATVAVADKAVANQYATMDKYLFSLSGESAEQSYSAVADVDNDFGTINASSNTTLTVTAQDSRGIQTAVNQTVSVVPYSAPVVVATAARQNNFDNTTDIHIEGTASLLSVGGVTKNDVDNSTGVEYRYRETGGTWGSWTGRTSSFSTTTGAVTTSDFTLSLDNTKVWDIEVRITDSLTSTTTALEVSQGVAIMRIGTDGFVYNQEEILMQSHVGQIIMSTALTSTSAVEAIYGGTWVAWGEGRVPIGMGDNGTTNYTTVEATGGAESVASASHTHSMSHTHSHNHRVPFAGESGGIFWSSSRPFGTEGSFTPNKYANTGTPGGSSAYDRSDTDATASSASNTGSTAPSATSVMQPWKTCYMWKRTV